MIDFDSVRCDGCGRRYCKGCMVEHKKKLLCVACYSDSNKKSIVKEKLSLYIISALIILLTLQGVNAENWRLAGGSTVGSNFSGVANQGFYYQYANNESNMTSFTSTGCGTMSTWWGPDSSCNIPVVGNRTDFSEYNTNKYLWMHPVDTNYGALIKFVAPITAEYSFNTSFYKTTGGNNVLFNVSKNGRSGTNLYSVTLGGSGTSSFNTAINLTAGENIVWFVNTADSVGGDSSGIIINITNKVLSGDSVVVTVYSPQDWIYNSSNISINFSATGGTIDKLFYNNGTNNISYTNATTISLNSGLLTRHNFTFYANNTAGTLGNTARSFWVNLTPTVYYWQNGSVYYPSCGSVFTIANDTADTIMFNWTKSNVTPNIYFDYILILDGLVDYTLGNFDNNTFNYTINDLYSDYYNPGIYYMKLLSYAGTGNYGLASNCTITLCKNDYQPINQPCTDELKLIVYEDANTCPSQYHFPSALNGTYQNCTATPSVVIVESANTVLWVWLSIIGVFTLLAIFIHGFFVFFVSLALIPVIIDTYALTNNNVFILIFLIVIALFLMMIGFGALFLDKRLGGN